MSELPCNPTMLRFLLRHYGSTQLRASARRSKLLHVEETSPSGARTMYAALSGTPNTPSWMLRTHSEAAFLPLTYFSKYTPACGSSRRSSQREGTSGGPRKQRAPPD